MQTNNNLFTIYGAKLSAKGNRVNISLVSGEGQNKTWATVSVALEGNGKTKAVIKDGFAYVKIALLEDKKATPATDEVDELPF